MKKIAIPVLLALLAATACWPFSGGGLGEMKVKRESDAGKVQIQRGDETINVADSEPLEVGDVVSTSGQGRARIRLLGADNVFLGTNTEVRVSSTKAVAGPLHTGSLVVATDGGLRVSFSDVEATSTGGTFRIDKGLASVRAGTYSGNVRIETPGEPRVSLSKLFEVQAAASDLRDPEPYHVDEGDPWDRIYLKDVIALDEELSPLTRGLQSQLGSSRPTLAYFHALAEHDVSFMKRYLSRPTIDLLTAFVIANHAPGALDRDFQRAFKLFDEGADWAVTASILNASFKPLVAELTDIASATGAVAGGSGGQAVFTVAAAQAVNGASGGGPVVPPPGGGGGGTGPGGGGNGTGPGDGGGGGTDPGDGGSASPSPQDCGIDVQCQVDQIPRPSPSPSGLIDPIGGGGGK